MKKIIIAMYCVFLFSQTAFAAESCEAKAAAIKSLCQHNAIVGKVPTRKHVTSHRHKPAKRHKMAMASIIGKNVELGRYEVTQAEWRSVMGNNPSFFKSCGGNCPVEQVSWDDIQIYLKKLNAKTGKQYRLPTEVEWEIACYGINQAVYCGGDDLHLVGWHSGDSNRKSGINRNGSTHAVGKKKANIYGMYDMTGNVWEWLQDHYDNTHNWRVIRGGSWDNGAEGVKAIVRHRYGQAVRDRTLGFRLARTLP